MIKIVGVRFKNAGKIYYFDPVELEVEKSIDVVVETARGLEYGTVVVGPKEIDESELVSPLKPIIRIATDEDRQVYLENKEKAKETFELCQQKIKEHDLNMFLIDCEYTFDRNKLIFYFTAEGRIDFRELVKVDEAKGKVIEVNPLLEQVRIEFNDKTIKVCHKDEVKVLHEPKKCGGCGSLRDEGLDEATLRELKKLED